MSNQIDAIEVLLNDTKRIVKHQDEIKILRGEYFNIFSILKIESRENGTHSAFLGELLNPLGSHLFKTIFLQHFLKVIEYNGGLDINTAKLELEKHIGTRNDYIKQGGRIDIYIYDNNGHTICIENKIYANDQFSQIERYANHNTSKNTVYYLTLNGDEASNDSKGELQHNKDYYCLSYKKVIIDWLELCLKEAVAMPILRETIKQYILLVKKITNQLSDHNMDKEIQELIVKNYNSAKIIEANVWKIELEETYKFLNEIKTTIEKTLTKNWNVSIDDDLNKSWSGLYVQHQNWDELAVKMEGQSKISWNTSIYGIAADQTIWDRNDLKNRLSNVSILQQGFKESRYWTFYRNILDFNNTDERAQLFDKEKRTALVYKIATLLTDLAIECETPLSNIKRI
jgi:hypothetical protein